MENVILDLVRELRELDGSGTRVLADGTVLIRKNPAREDGLFSKGYLHEIYGGISNDQIDRLESLVQRKFPPQLRDFYRCANGLSLFSGSLTIAGLRDDYSRDFEKSFPVSLQYGNTIEPPRDDDGKVAASVQEIRFGGYSFDGSELMMSSNADEPEIFALPRWKLKPILCRWADFPTFLMAEVDRMAELYREKDRLVDPLNPLPPPWELQLE